jgi:predicted PurR-regulated permease PerM
MDMSEIVILLSLMLWASLWGVVGLFLAVPLTSVFLIVADEIAEATKHKLFRRVVELCKR